MVEQRKFSEVVSLDNSSEEKQQYTRDFKGVWIPKDIYLNQELNWTDKVILMEIDSLDNEKGCFANNKYFAEFLSLSETSVSKSISKLKKLGYVKQYSFNGRARVLQSSLEVNLKADLNFTSNQPLRKVQVSYNSIINTNNIKKEKDCQNLKAAFNQTSQTEENHSNQNSQISNNHSEQSEYEKLKSEHQSNLIPIARHPSQNWQYVHQEFIKYYGDNTYMNWFRDNIILIEETPEEIIMQCNSGFACEYVNRNYMKGIKRDNRWVRKGIRELWTDKYPNIQKDKIKLLTEPQILELKLKQSGDK